MTVDRFPANVSGLALTLALAGLLSACSRDCTDMLGTYPPDAVTMTGVESVEVPYAAWGCLGYDLDAIDSVRVVPVESEVTIEVTLREGSTVDVRVDDESVPADRAPIEGDNAWTLALPPDAEGVSIRICSEEDACAIYVAELQQ